jgi:DNA-binding winged helix-turn-helix (wHTH) protein
VTPLTQRPFYEFDAFRIDTALSRLARAGEPVPLPPKAFDLLILLARNTDRVMTKAELMEALWPDTFVDEANLTQHVYTLRKALGDQPNGQPFIETVPRRGYRLATAVREVVEAASTNAAAGDVVRPPRDLSAISLATRAIAPEGERKRGTVLDCRIANAAAVVERLGPVAARDLTRDLLNVAAEELGRYGGVITERRVDGFVALFGAPVVHEDDGRRAVLAALGIQQRFGRLAALESNQDEPINLRIGLGTGVLVVTRTAGYAEVEYAAVGEPIRVADLLQQIASPGMVLIGDTTRRAVDGDIDTVPSGSHEAAGAVFRVVGLLGRHDARVGSICPNAGTLCRQASRTGGARRSRIERPRRQGSGCQHRRRSGNREIASAARMHAARGRARGHGSTRRTVRLVRQQHPLSSTGGFHPDALRRP